MQAQEQDDELEMVEDTNTDNKKRTKCPITKCTFVNPVKRSFHIEFFMISKICNHTYSRDAIMELLARSRSISCPVSGCSKKVTESDLVPDEDMIWYLVDFWFCILSFRKSEIISLFFSYCLFKQLIPKWILL